MESLGPALCEAAAAASTNGRLMFMTPRQLYEWVETKFGTLTSTDVKNLVATLATPLPKASHFPTHHAAFVRNIRRLQRGQMRVAVGIMPNDHQLFSYLYETVYALPEFLQSLGLFSLNHPDIDTQTHVSLSAFLTAQMPFILGQSGAGKYAGSAQHPPPTPPPPPPNPTHPPPSPWQGRPSAMRKPRRQPELLPCKSRKHQLRLSSQLSAIRRSLARAKPPPMFPPLTLSPPKVPPLCAAHWCTVSFTATAPVSAHTHRQGVSSWTETMRPTPRRCGPPGTTLLAKVLSRTW